MYVYTECLTIHDICMLVKLVQLNTKFLHYFANDHVKFGVIKAVEDFQFDLTCKHTTANTIAITVHLLYLSWSFSPIFFN